MNNQEPIMIDDVDVAECGYKTEVYEDCKCEIHDFEQCSNFPNCYYKQLKRKEQECERLKHDNGYEVGALEKTIDKLKAEIEKEKALKQVYLSCYKTKHGDIKGKLFKYEKLKQALQEIRKELKQFIRESNPYEVDTETLKEILQEIKEVINE